VLKFKRKFRRLKVKFLSSVADLKDVSFAEEFLKKPCVIFDDFVVRCCSYVLVTIAVSGDLCLLIYEAVSLGNRFQVPKKNNFPWIFRTVKMRRLLVSKRRNGLPSQVASYPGIT
jgi:hypothetical protein